MHYIYIYAFLSCHRSDIDKEVFAGIAEFAGIGVFAGMAVFAGIAVLLAWQYLLA